MPDEAKTFMVEDAHILFPNFSGEVGPYNKAGDSLFSVILDPEVAKRMLEDGWAVKYLKSRDDDVELGDPYIQVKVNFNNRPPNVVLITSTARTNLDATTIGILDYANIRMCDLIARAYNWEVGEKSGIKAYLQTMFVTIEEDALQLKYAQMEG